MNGRDIKKIGLFSSASLDSNTSEPMKSFIEVSLVSEARAEAAAYAAEKPMNSSGYQESIHRLLGISDRKKV